ncbi:CapA family protein [Chryseolinea sp. T2]|uniref:CapA family protein n=1 Tax=Chryseolinea sp. T2 TaxID=3129255 RepID=UPI00307722B2
MSPRLLRQLQVATLALGFLSSHAQDTTRISILFGGDVMGHDSQIASAYEAKSNQYNYSSCFKFVTPVIEAPDLAIANLEVTLAGPPFQGYPQFSSPDALAVQLKTSGFDALVTANNHCVDRGKKGLERTIMRLDSLGMPHTGTFVDSISRVNQTPLMIRKNGFYLALLNYTYGTNGIAVPKGSVVNHLDTAVMRRDIEIAKALKPDAIIVFTHWGTEYQSLPEKRQLDLTEFCFRNGVTMVIGAHPHVIQPMEWRKDKNQFVAYSLGNFVSGQRKRYTDGGAMAYIELEKIQHTDDSSSTRIQNAEYYLQWVYRTVDSQKDYYVIPVIPADLSGPSFIKDAASATAYKTFIEDSRLLYRKHNKNVTERTVLPASYHRQE